MARVMLAWELGGGLGHAMPLAQLAEALLDRGHEVHLVWKDLSLSRTVLGPTLEREQLHLWQAPIFLPKRSNMPDPASFADLLLRAGYLNADELLGCAHAWRELMMAIEPKLLVADHSPTALLTARGLPMRVAMFGNGFMIPPALEPMPTFRDREQSEATRLASSEALALASCNEILSTLGEAPLTALRQLLDADEKFLLGWPELDHYRPSRAAQPLPSWGWPPSRSIGIDPVWPTAQGPRIFGYLQRSHPACEAIIACLRAGPWSSLVYLAGASDDDVGRASGEHLRLVNQPLTMSMALAQAELLLTHGGGGTAYSALQAGLPMVLLPLHTENLLLARRISAAGAGITLWPNEVGQTLAKAIAAMLSSPGFATAARALAQRNGAAIDGDVIGRILGRCEELLNTAA